MLTISAGLITPKWICLLHAARWKRGREQGSGRQQAAGGRRQRRQQGAQTLGAPIAHIFLGTFGSVKGPLLLTRGTGLSGSGGAPGLAGAPGGACGPLGAPCICALVQPPRCQPPPTARCQANGTQTCLQHASPRGPLLADTVPVYVRCSGSRSEASSQQPCETCSVCCGTQGRLSVALDPIGSACAPSTPFL